MCSLFPLVRTVTSRQCRKTVTKENLSLPMLDYVGSPCKGLGRIRATHPKDFFFEAIASSQDLDYVVTTHVKVTR